MKRYSCVENQAESITYDQSWPPHIQLQSKEAGTRHGSSIYMLFPPELCSTLTCMAMHTEAQVKPESSVIPRSEISPV